MADESGGITLRIDADTARYIAEISKAAEKTKSLADPTKEIGDGWNRVGDSVKQTADRLIGFSIFEQLGIGAYNPFSLQTLSITRV